MESSRIAYLRQKIEELKNQLPAHSIPPTMLLELDELEDELEKENFKLKIIRDENAKENSIN